MKNNTQRIIHALRKSSFDIKNQDDFRKKLLSELYSSIDKKNKPEKLSIFTYFNNNFMNNSILIKGISLLALPATIAGGAYFAAASRATIISGPSSIVQENQTNLKTVEDLKSAVAVQLQELYGVSNEQVKDIFNNKLSDQQLEELRQKKADTTVYYQLVEMKFNKSWDGRMTKPGLLSKAYTGYEYGMDLSKPVVSESWSSNTMSKHITRHGDELLRFGLGVSNYSLNYFRFVDWETQKWEEKAIKTYYKEDRTFNSQSNLDSKEMRLKKLRELLTQSAYSNEELRKELTLPTKKKIVPLESQKDANIGSYQTVLVDMKKLENGSTEFIFEEKNLKQNSDKIRYVIELTKDNEAIFSKEEYYDESGMLLSTKVLKTSKKMTFDQNLFTAKEMPTNIPVKEETVSKYDNPKEINTENRPVYVDGVRVK